MAALCKAPTKSAGIGLSITAVCKNAGKKTLGQDDFFVVITNSRLKREFGNNGKTHSHLNLKLVMNLKHIYM